MKFRIFGIIVPIMLIIALFTYFVAYNKDYDFMSNLDTISHMSWSNPIDTIKDLYDVFYNVLHLNWSGDFFGSLQALPQLIYNLLIAPIAIIWSILYDAFNILKAFMIMLGFPSVAQ